MLARDSLLPWRTAAHNVELGLESRGVSRQERRARASELLALVGLGGFERAFPWQLSQGMRQRAALARTLAPDPSVLLMDEPSAALDARTKLHVQAEFLRIWEATDEAARPTVLFVTHDLQEALLLSDLRHRDAPAARPDRIRHDEQHRAAASPTTSARSCSPRASATSTRSSSACWKAMSAPRGGALDEPRHHRPRGHRRSPRAGRRRERAGRHPRPHRAPTLGSITRPQSGAGDCSSSCRLARRLGARGRPGLGQPAVHGSAHRGVGSAERVRHLGPARYAGLGHRPGRADLTGDRRADRDPDRPAPGRLPARRPDPRPVPRPAQQHAAHRAGAAVHHLVRPDAHDQDPGVAVSIIAFIVLFNARAGVKGIDPDHLVVARQLGLSRREVFQPGLPGSVPTIFAGVRLAITYALLGVVASEMVAARTGLGLEIVRSANNLRIDGVFAILFVLAGAATLIAAGLERLEGSAAALAVTATAAARGPGQRRNPPRPAGARTRRTAACSPRCGSSPPGPPARRPGVISSTMRRCSSQASIPRPRGTAHEPEQLVAVPDDQLGEMAVPRDRRDRLVEGVVGVVGVDPVGLLHCGGRPHQRADGAVRRRRRCGAPRRTGRTSAPAPREPRTNPAGHARWATRPAPCGRG